MLRVQSFLKLVAIFCSPWVPEVIFFARLKERSAAEPHASPRREAPRSKKILRASLMRLRRGSLSQSREKNNLWHPGYLLLCYRLKFRVAYFTVKTDVTRKCWCVTNTRKKCSATKYRPSENTTTVLFTRKQCQTFYFFNILIGYRDAEFRSSLYPENLILICD